MKINLKRSQESIIFNILVFIFKIFKKFSGIYYYIFIYYSRPHFHKDLNVKYLICFFYYSIHHNKLHK